MSVKCVRQNDAKCRIATIGWIIGLFGVLVFTATANAQLPTTRLDAVSPVGGAPGTSFELKIQGNDLDDVDRLIFSDNRITSERKMAEPTAFDDAPVPVPETFLVTIPNDLPGGTLEVRCQGRYGLSNPRRFLIDTAPQTIETEPNETLETANSIQTPILVHGRSEGNADVDCFRFAGQPGQRILIRAEARSVDSRMDPRIALLDPQGNTLASGEPGPSGDHRIEATLNAAGDYCVKIHDVTFRQGVGFVYRLAIGQQPQLESVFPPSLLPGTSGPVTVYGFGLPGGSASPFQLGGRTLEQLTLQATMPADVAELPPGLARVEAHQAGIDAIELQVGDAPFRSEPIRLTAAGAATIVETDNNDQPQQAQRLELPCEVVGRFYPRRDVDWFEFEAQKGDVWSIDVISNRLGWPTDPALLVQQITVDAEGKETIKDLIFLDDTVRPNDNNTRSGRHEFDTRSNDPSYRFEAPETGRYRLFLRDAAASVRTDPRWTYRLTIRKPVSDFRLVAVPGESPGGFVLRRSGRDVIRINAFRLDGFDGEIRVTVQGLPAGVTAAPLTIGPGSDMGTLILSTTADAPASVGQVEIFGEAILKDAATGETRVTHRAKFGQALAPFQFSQPNSTLPSVAARLMPSLQVQVLESDPAPVNLKIGHDDGRVYETVRGGVVKVPYTVTRQPNIGGDLQGFPIDVPVGTNAQQVGLQASGEFELRFQQQTPPGEFTIYLAGFNQNMSYTRNPEAAAAAKERQERIGKLLETARQTEREKQTASQQAQQALNQAQQRLQQRETELNQARQQLAQAEQKRSQADNTAKQTAETASANPADESAKQAAATAMTAAAEALKEQTAAEEKVKLAVAAFEMATAERETANTAKTTSEMEYEAARKFTQEAQQEKQRADQRAQQTQQQANPRNINVFVPSSPVTVRIAEFPIVLAEFPAETALVTGQAVEVPIRFERKYEFTGAVNLQVQAPQGVNGIQINAPQVPDNQTEGLITLTAQPNATAGKHELKVRLQMNVNGANLTMDRTLMVIVPEPVVTN